MLKSKKECNLGMQQTNKPKCEKWKFGKKPKTKIKRYLLIFSCIRIIFKWTRKSQNNDSNSPAHEKISRFGHHTIFSDHIGQNRIHKNGFKHKKCKNHSEEKMKENTDNFTHQLEEKIGFTKFLLVFLIILVNKNLYLISGCIRNQTQMCSQ